MAKLIAAINMSLDGFCDHTVGVGDEEIHRHYAHLLHEAGAVLYGRITYQMMEYWRPIAKNPTGEKFADEFAVAMDQVPKLVFSRTLKNVDWESARLAKRDLEEEVLELKQNLDKDFFVCSPSLISFSTKLNLVDEYQLCIHPVIAGSGLPLFKNIKDNIFLTLKKTKIFGGGAVLHSYVPKKENS